VSVQSDPKRLDLRVSPESGLAPLDTEIIFEGNFIFAEPISVTYTGPGMIDFLQKTEPDVFPVKVIVPGIYYFTGTAKDASGVSYSDTVALLAVDRTALDELLQEKWNGME
jgi:hypothetical protein